MVKIYHAIQISTFLLTSACLATEMPACPELLETRQDAISAPSGWSASPHIGPHRFHRVTFKFESDPGELREDGETRKQGLIFYHWDFPPLDGLQLVCEYDDTNATLIRPLKAKSCDVANREIYGGETTVSTSCDLIPN